MTVAENQNEINELKNRLHRVEKILDLLHPIWRYEEIEHIKQLELEE